MAAPNLLIALMSIAVSLIYLVYEVQGLHDQEDFLRFLSPVNFASTREDGRRFNARINVYERQVFLSQQHSNTCLIHINSKTSAYFVLKLIDLLYFS